MFANRELTNEEYALLPCYSKAYRCCCDEKITSNLISCNPPYLQFPHDDPTQHVIKVNVWNRSKEFLELVVESPRTNVFQVFYDKQGLYGGCHTTLYVQCTPHDRKVCFDCLRIRVTKKNKETDLVSLPLQLFPGFSWFTLPKLIVMPHITVGNAAEAVISFPKVTGSEKYFIVIRSPEVDAITVSPLNGVIGMGCSNGEKDLVIRYTPKEFITLVYIIEVHFPGVDTASHDIIVFARAIPGLERDKIMKETSEILKWRPKPFQKKLPEPKLIYSKPNATSSDTSFYDILEDEALAKEEDLTKPAGIIHFLLRKGGKLHEMNKSIGPLGITMAEERKIYDQKLKEFHKNWNRENIRQKNILVQNYKSYFGQEPIEDQWEVMENIIHEKDMHWMQYEKSLGLTENDAADMTRKKVLISNQRSLRRVGEDYSGEMHDFDSNEMSNMNEELHQFTREIALSRFIQAVYKIVTQYRANKRIVKLNLLKKQMRAAQKEKNLRKAKIDSARKIQFPNKSPRSKNNTPQTTSNESSSGGGQSEVGLHEPHLTNLTKLEELDEFNTDFYDPSKPFEYNRIKS